MKKLNLLPKPLSIEDVIRHGDLLKPLETLYDGVQFSATLSLLTSILCFCDELWRLTFYQLNYRLIDGTSTWNRTKDTSALCNVGTGF